MEIFSNISIFKDWFSANLVNVKVLQKAILSFIKNYLIFARKLSQSLQAMLSLNVDILFVTSFQKQLNLKE